MFYYFNAFLLCFAFFGLLTDSINAMDNKIAQIHANLDFSDLTASRIGPQEFRKITTYAFSYLQKHKDDIKCEVGESGFIRIILPPEKAELSCNSGLYYVEKIRINYWPTNIRLNDENVHNHTRNFESMIIHGEYRNNFYIANDCVDGDHIRYRINRGGDSPNCPLFEGRTDLRISQTPSHKTGDIIVYPTEVVHRISYVSPNTLSLNVVFKESNDYYDIFLPFDNSEGFKIQMNFLSNDDSKKFITEIMALIEDALNA